MSHLQAQPTGLNDLQMTLLRLFNRPMSERETIQLRDLLTAYYTDQLLNSVDNDVRERGITEADYERFRRGDQ